MNLELSCGDDCQEAPFRGNCRVRDPVRGSRQGVASFCTFTSSSDVEFYRVGKHWPVDKAGIGPGSTEQLSVIWLPNTGPGKCPVLCLPDMWSSGCFREGVAQGGC